MARPGRGGATQPGQVYSTDRVIFAFIDVVGLKATNDPHGHAAGDRVLRQVADTVRGVVRDYDLMVRYGGDGFLCALSDLGLEKHDNVRGGDRRARRSAGFIDHGPARRTRARGNAGAPDGRADAAMYAERAARQDGRDAVGSPVGRRRTASRVGLSDTTAPPSRSACTAGILAVSSSRCTVHDSSAT
ncbi:MAG: hypothetical protein NVS3B26_17230 [Mycobacteriales bacterium]